MKLILIVDGGTTNLRVTAVSADDHRALAKSTAAGGVKHTAVDGNNHQLKRLLKQCVHDVLEQTGCTEADVERCIAFGMITSNMGLYEIPHLIAPVGIKELRAGMKRKVFPEIAPFEIEFIPGVRNFSGTVDEDTCAAMDMMRGEEVEAIGLYDAVKPNQAALFVLPGSHNKFVKMDEKGRIGGCMTSISGEMLDAITHDTILADALNHSFCSAETYDRHMAVCGAQACMNSGLGRAAFSGRILNTLGSMSADKVQSWLLGAVMAEDVRAMTAFESAASQVYIAGKAPIQQAMRDVLEAVSGVKAVCVPAETSALMGLRGALIIAGME